MQGFAETCVQTYIFLCRRKSPLGHESRRANFAMKFMAAIVKEEGRDPPTERDRPENVPEGEGHGHAAQHEVGDGETHDEVVPRRPHYGLAQDGVLHG